MTRTRIQLILEAVQMSLLADKNSLCDGVFGPSLPEKHYGTSCIIPFRHLSAQVQVHFGCNVP